MEKKLFYSDTYGRINYNAELIQMSKKYDEMEKEYHELLDKRKKCEEEYEKVRKEYEKETQEPNLFTFYSKCEKEIRKKYRELDESYKKANDILTNQMKQSNSCLSYFFAIMLFAIFERLFYVSFLK
jgi:vacuolar-type H+-ATPase subunit H